MREIFTDTAETLSRTIFSNGSESNADGPVTVDVYSVETGSPIVTGDATNSPSTGVYEYTIGGELTADVGSYRLVWNYSLGGENYSPEDNVDIVTPYVLQSELPTELQEPNKTYDEYVRMERIVRHVINAYTSQDFYYRRNRNYTVRGNDSDFLALPKRLVNLTSVEIERDDLSTSGDESYDITQYVAKDPDGGNLVRRKMTGGESFRHDPDGLLSSGPLFKHGKHYVVTGDWGWRTIPGGVSLAAGLLMEAYFCGDATYRDKNIANIRSADWRIEFAVTGSSTTGSANADMILSEYKNFNLVII